MYIYIRHTGGDGHYEFNIGHISLERVGEFKRTTRNWKNKLKKIPNFKKNSNFNWMKKKIGR
jgi:hypothetical protein